MSLNCHMYLVTYVYNLIISCRCNNAVKHFQVTYDAGQYHFGLVTFASLDQFLDHFDNQPLIGGEAGMLFVLLSWLSVLILYRNDCSP